MLDIKYIRENRDLVKQAIHEKHLDGKVDVDEILETHATYVAKLTAVEEARALRNSLSDAIARVADDAREKLIVEASQVKADLVDIEEELSDLEKKLQSLLYKVPNVISKEVPVGKDDSENVVVRKWGTPPVFDFTPKDHVDIGEALDILDIETSAKVSGSRFNYLKNEAVRLQFALVNFVFDTLSDTTLIKKLAGELDPKPYTPVIPPVIIKGDVAKKMARFDPIEDRYYLEQDDQMLVGSAEHSLGPIFLDTTLTEEQLPIRLVGYSTAFRREAGTYGKDTRGILRRHQFDKLEIEVFSTPETGLAEQNLIVALQEHMVQALGIPYQVVMVCTGDMGKPDYRQLDIECWMPGQGKYRETHTSDYMTDFQARRLNTKYKSKDSATRHVHMNDATAFAIGRILIAILENYQNKDGSVTVPEVLRKYLSFESITKNERL